MPSHRLILDKPGAPDVWLLDWDTSTMTLRDPRGEIVFRVSLALARRIINFYRLFNSDEIEFATPLGLLAFKRDSQALSDLGQFVAQGLISDCEFRTDAVKQGTRAARRGFAMLGLGGGLFALFCWWAAAGPTPSFETLDWMHSTSWAIRLSLLALLGLAARGMRLIYVGWRRLRLVRAIERELAPGNTV
jgi:hypothetical protein